MPDDMRAEIDDCMSSTGCDLGVRRTLLLLTKLGLNALKAGIPLPEMPEMPRYRSPGPDKPPSD